MHLLSNIIGKVRLNDKKDNYLSYSFSNENFQISCGMADDGSKSILIKSQLNEVVYAARRRKIHRYPAQLLQNSFNRTGSLIANFYKNFYFFPMSSKCLIV